MQKFEKELIDGFAEVLRMMKNTRNSETLEKVKDYKYLPKIQEVFDAFSGKPLEWFEFCHSPEKPLFEIYTLEYIYELGVFLKEAGYKKILEVGTGDGKLSYFLQKK